MLLCYSKKCRYLRTIKLLEDVFTSETLNAVKAKVCSKVCMKQTSRDDGKLTVNTN